jgi:hypothetical protein
MKKCFILLFLVFLLLPLFSDSIKLPIFYLKYDYGLGIEENEDTEETETTDNTHKASIRIKDIWSSLLTTNLTFTFFDKNYEDTSGSYNYYSLDPEFTFRFSDRVKLNTGFRSKWYVYENDANNYTDLMFKTALTFKPVKLLSLVPSFKGTYSIYDNEERSKQTYVFGFGITAKLNAFILSGKYRGTLRNPLNEESTVTMDFANNFGVGLTFDPNRITDKN